MMSQATCATQARRLARDFMNGGPAQPWRNFAEQRQQLRGTTN